MSVTVAEPNQNRDVVLSKPAIGEVTEEHHPPERPLLRRWFREPLLHFLLIGSLLFVVYAARDQSSQPGSKLST